MEQTAAYRAAVMEQRRLVLKPHGRIQPKKYATNAERQKAYRERKRKAV